MKGNKATTIFCLLKTDQKQHVEVASIFNPSKLYRKCTLNYVDYSPIKITSKKHVEMTWKFVDIDVSANANRSNMLSQLV